MSDNSQQEYCGVLDRLRGEKVMGCSGVRRLFYTSETQKENLEIPLPPIPAFQGTVLSMPRLILSANENMVEAIRLPVCQVQLSLDDPECKI
jgi:hypothetical protein